MNPSDLERGLGESSRSFPQQRASFPSASSGHTDGLNKSKSRRSDLEIFQAMTGICFLNDGGEAKPESERPPRPASVIQDIFVPSKAARNRYRNRGLYDRALSLDMKNRVMYALTHYIISGLYMLQILLTATFTALSGEATSSRVALTALGAVSTVVAGMLAWLTGQGMPVRFRRARDQYREVVRAIERTERMFAVIDDVRWSAAGGGGNGIDRPDPRVEHDKLSKLFDDARLDQEANYPESHQSPGAGQISKKHDELVEEVGKAHEQKEEMKLRMQALQQELDALRSPKGGDLGGGASGGEHSVKDFTPFKDIEGT